MRALMDARREGEFVPDRQFFDALSTHPIPYGFNKGHIRCCSFVFIASASQDRGPVFMCVGDQLKCQTGLADARFPGQHDQMTVCLPGQAPLMLQLS